MPVKSGQMYSENASLFILSGDSAELNLINKCEQGTVLKVSPRECTKTMTWCPALSKLRVADESKRWRKRRSSWVAVHNCSQVTTECTHEVKWRLKHKVWTISGFEMLQGRLEFLMWTFLASASMWLRFTNVLLGCSCVSANSSSKSNSMVGVLFALVQSQPRNKSHWALPSASPGWSWVPVKSSQVGNGMAGQTHAL